MENNNTSGDNANWSPPTTNQTITGQELPGAKQAYTLGLIGMILSFICCCFIHLVGLVLGIIAIIKSKEAIDTYEANPSAYDEVMYKKAKTAKTFGMVAIAFGTLWLIWAGINFMFHPFGNAYDYQELMRKFK